MPTKIAPNPTAVKPFRYDAEHPVPPLRPITQGDIDAYVTDCENAVRHNWPTYGWR